MSDNLAHRPLFRCPLDAGIKLQKQLGFPGLFCSELVLENNCTSGFKSNYWGHGEDIKANKPCKTCYKDLRSLDVQREA